MYKGLTLNGFFNGKWHWQLGVVYELNKKTFKIIAKVTIKLQKKKSSLKKLKIIEKSNEITE